MWNILLAVPSHTLIWTTQLNLLEETKEKIGWHITVGYAAELEVYILV